MIIKLECVNQDEFADNIRKKIMCGRCASSTLLLWEKPAIGNRPRGTSIATIVDTDDDSRTNICYMVRCSFFKFNVDSPEDIIDCEGFKEKRKDAK